MERRIVEITISDGGNVDFTVYNDEIKKLNEDQFKKVIKSLIAAKSSVSLAKEMVK